MAKMKPAKRTIPLRTCITALVLSLSLFLPFISPALAVTDEVKWTKANIPTEGKAGGWVLASGSDIQHLTVSPDGTLYAYGKNLTYTLFKSTDGGYAWSQTGNVQDSIAAIATAPGNANHIYYATASDVYRSRDGGRTFDKMPANPGGAGSNNIEITSLDVAWLESNIIAVATRDTDSSQFGGVYTLDEGEAIPRWQDTAIGSYDVYAVAFSPNYASDRQLVAVVTDEIDTLVTTKIGDGGWGASAGNARLNRDNSGTPSPVAVAFSAAIAFPGDYDADASSGNYVQFIAIDTGTGNGDAYRIDGAETPANSSATDLNIGSSYGLSNLDATSLAVDGAAISATLLAGTATGAQTYFSVNSGKDWTRSKKEPTGESKTYVLMAPDFGTNHRAYAATSGEESALSISDNQSIWRQVSLIDTEISTILDVAPSPNYSQDNTLFMLTFGSEHSLWRSLEDGARWERIFSSSLPGVDTIEMVELPQQYGNDTQVVFIAGSSNGYPALWESANSGLTFTSRPAFDPTSGAPFSIDSWAVVNKTSLFAGSYDGTHGLVYSTANGGFFYSAAAVAGSQSLNSIALSPYYQQDKTIMVGNTNGWVFWSNDDGRSFEPLPGDATSPPLTGLISVAFDPGFNSNKTVYAASDTADKGVYRFTIGTSTDWERIDGTLPSGAKLNHLVLASDGTLYAADSRADTGVERCLNPAYSLGPTFETVTGGLGDGATLSGLWKTGHTLWSIDTTNTRLMTLTDILTSPVTLASPPNEASATGAVINHSVSNIRLDWDALTGATSYQWQIDYDANFSTVASGFEGNTRSSSIRLPALEPATTYNWRVRATAPVLSPWSARWSFTTSLETEPVALKLENPQAGAEGVSIKPVFQWNATSGADAYELLVSSDVHFTSPSIAKTDAYALPSSAWQSDVSLNYDTTYYWRVRAANGSSLSAWSAVGTFTTEVPPVVQSEIKPALGPTPTAPILPIPTTNHLAASFGLNPEAVPPSAAPVPPPPPPAPPAFPATPTWTVYLIGALFLTVFLLLVVIVLILVVALRRT